MQSLRAFPALTISLAALAALAGPAAAASPEVVSRLDGVSGTPFPADIGGSAADGRYVLLRPKSEEAAAQLGVDQPADVNAIYLRDRTTGTTSTLDLRVTPGGEAKPGTAIDLSDDAERVLFFTNDPEVLEAAGVATQPGDTNSFVVVASRAGGDLWAVRDAAGAPLPPSNVVLSDDGDAVVFTADDTSAPYAGTSIQRAHVGAPTEVLLSRPDAYPTVYGASGDLSTVLYRRDLLPSKRPSPAEYENAGARAIGLWTAQGARVIAQGKTVEGRIDPTGTCDASNLELRSMDPDPLAISADGRRVSYVDRSRKLAQSPGDEGTALGWTAWVLGPGGVKREVASTTDNAAHEVFARTLGASHDVYAESALKQTDWQNPGLDDFGTGYSVRSASVRSLNFDGGGLQNIPATFADGDRTVLWGSRTQREFLGETPPASLPYVYAEAIPGTPPASGSGASLWAAGVPDTADLKADVTWADCTAPAPVGTVDKYASIALRGPVVASASAGKVSFNAAPAGVRAATKATVELRLFGLSYWRKTLTATGDVTLARPPLWLPLTLSVTVAPKAAPGDAAPKALVLSRSVFAAR